MKTSRIKITVMLGLIVFASRTPAVEKEEHRLLADRVFAAVIAELGILKQDSSALILPPATVISLEKNLWQGKSFGEICAQFSGDDLARARFYWRGRTILEQLQPLASAVLEEMWRKRGGVAAAETWPVIRSMEQPNLNVVANYLLHHYVALRFAKLAGESGNQRQEAWRRALIYEAMAQSYLADAFSAGHLLVSSSEALAGFNRINTKQAHDFFGSEGVFVINSRGDAWRTFGDKLLHWFAPTYRAAFAAGASSLRELFLVYCASANLNVIPEHLKNWWQVVAGSTSLQALLNSIATPQAGEKYYTKIKLPTLCLLPMPIAASWSVRTDSVDEHGIHFRKHYPQLREKEHRDPDWDGLDKDFFYSKSAMIDTMIPNVLRGQDPGELIKSNPDIASVRYVQQRNYSPSYVGLLFNFEGGKKVNPSEKNMLTALGLGYGLVNDLILFKKIGVNLAFARHDSRRVLLSPTLGVGIKAGLLGGLIEAFHFEGGYAWGLRSPNKAHGFKTEVGLASPTIPLGFTYSGVTIRLKYQTMALEKKLRGVFLEFVLH